MPIRFRYLKPGGEEVAVEGLDELRAHILSGAVGEGTLLHDALTDEWAPAGAHSAFALASESGVGPGRAGPTDPLSMGDLSLDADFRELPRDAPDSRAMIEALLKERAEESEERHDDELRPDRYSSTLRTWVEPDGTSPPPTDPHHGGEPPVPEASAWSPPPAPAPAPPSWARTQPVDRSWARPSSSPNRPRRSGPSALLWVAFALLVGATALAGAWRQASQAAVPPPDAASAALAVTVPVPSRASDVLGRLAATEGEAFRDMVEGMDSLRGVYRVHQVPAVWLEGRYLADAGAWPEVEEYWVRYQDFIDAVRRQDRALFRQSLAGRLHGENVSGPMFAIRIARALEEFEASQPIREDMYAHMEDLAEASLALHELLLERSADIEYDPVTRNRASREPVLEAYAGDEVLRESMWQLMERIFENLEFLHDGAPLARDQLTDQLLEGIRATGGM